MQWRQKYKIPDHRLNRVFGHYGVSKAQRPPSVIWRCTGAAVRWSIGLRLWLGGPDALGQVPCRFEHFLHGGLVLGGGPTR
jgi:hypothetical protein